MNTRHPVAAAIPVELSAVQALQCDGATLEVWPGCWHTLTNAEAAVVASTAFQRLRRLRQMGMAFHAWPNAENTRASHSLGVSYWASRFLAALDACPDAASRAVLARSRRALAPLSLDLVVRLFALLHDIDLLPLGHTLRYQSGVFVEGAGRPRLAACITAIKADARGSAFAHASTSRVRQQWLAAFEAHLDAAADALAGRMPDPGLLIDELVNSGLGADLMDFALRDSAAIGRVQSRHDCLAELLRLVDSPAGIRLALALGGPHTARARVDAVDDLYRARFEIFAASVCHPVKLAADAMLDFVLRRLGPAACATLLPHHHLLTIGDDQLLDAVVEADEAAADPATHVPVARWLRQGHLHQEVWRSNDLAQFRTRPDAAQALDLEPHWRTAAEQRLQHCLHGGADGELIVAVAAATMQRKPATALLCAGGDRFTLADAGEQGFAVNAPRVSAQYAALWSIRVYLRAGSTSGRRESVRAAATALFGCMGAWA